MYRILRPIYRLRRDGDGKIVPAIMNYSDAGAYRTLRFFDKETMHHGPPNVASYHIETHKG
jgi:hypothetical protein